MINLISGSIMDLVVAAAGVMALVRAGRCARARGLIRMAGVALILNGLIAISWRAWSWYVFESSEVGSPGAAGDSMVDLYWTLGPLRGLVGTVVLVTGIVLLIIALVIRGRQEFGPAQFHAALAGDPAPSGHWQTGPGQPGASPQWSPPPPAHGGPPAQSSHNPGNAWNAPPSHDWRPAPGTGPQQPQQPPPYPPQGAPGYHPPPEDPGTQPR